MFKNKRETKRWLNALVIAKIVFEDEGYHIKYLEQIEEFIRRRRMYSPKIKEELIPELFGLAAERKVPMTRLVNQIIREYLERTEKDKGKAIVIQDS